MDPMLRALLDSTTPEDLARLQQRDALLDALRVDMAGVDMAGIDSRSERGRKRQRLLDALRQAEARGELRSEEAAEWRRLIRRIAR